MSATEAQFSGAVNVGIASTLVRPENHSRQEITVQNDGANIVYLQLQTVPGVAPTAVANQGIRLNASGGSWSSATFKGGIAGIALTAPTVVVVTEV